MLIHRLATTESSLNQKFTFGIFTFDSPGNNQMKLPVESFILFFYSVEMIINCIKIQIVRPFKVRGSANKKNQILERVKYLDFFSFARWYSIHNELGSYLRFWFPCGIFNKCMTDIIYGKCSGFQPIFL